MSAERLDRRPPRGGDERRTALLASLDGLLRESSLEEVHVADISRGAGVTRSAFYFYFESKELAVAALADQGYDDIRASTLAWTRQDRTPRQRIETMIRETVAALERNRHLYRALCEARATCEPVRRLWDSDRDSFVAPLAELVEADRRSGLAPPGPDAHSLVATLLDLNDRVLERLLLDEQEDAADARERRIATLVTIWLRSIYGREDKG